MKIANVKYFKKKPIVVEAIQFDKLDSVNLMIASWPEFIKFAKWKGFPEFLNLQIETLEGTHTANQYDWIIKGVKGEFYPVNPDIFEMTYEPAD